MYRAFKGCGSLRESAYFNSWITRILINACNAYLKKRKYEIAMETVPERAQAQYDALGLKQAITKLPQELRAVIILRYFTGLTLEETAQALGIARGTASSRQQRALKILRLDLEEDI